MHLRRVEKSTNCSPSSSEPSAIYAVDGVLIHLGLREGFDFFHSVDLIDNASKKVR